MILPGLQVDLVQVACWDGGDIPAPEAHGDLRYGSYDPVHEYEYAPGSYRARSQGSEAAGSEEAWQQASAVEEFMDPNDKNEHENGSGDEGALPREYVGMDAFHDEDVQEVVAGGGGDVHPRDEL